MLHFPKWKVFLVLTVCILGIFYALPNFSDRSEGDPLLPFMPSEKINLGLDLRGGSYLLLEVGFDAFLKEQLETLRDDIRTELRKNKQGYVGLKVQDQDISFNLIGSGDFDTVRTLIRDITRDVIVRNPGDGKIVVSYNDTYLKELKRSVVDQSIEIVRRRVDETGTREPSIQREGDERILLQVPGLENPEEIKRLLGKTAKLTFHMLHNDSVTQSRKGRIPPGAIRVEGMNKDATGVPYSYLLKRKVMLSGDMLVHASSTFDQGGQPAVSFRFNSLGGRKFAEITKNNVGKPFAIVLDNKVLSAPVINEPIPSGSGIISGNFTPESATELALLLRAGALPAPLGILEERTVGPSLGADSIAAGKIAIIIGICFVVCFMLLSYGLFGIFSNLALVMNLMLILAALTFFQATLTLPGIAGIVLTMGMAVDANVLIFERIREEMNVGNTPFASIDNGFRHAFKTIIDSNLTTLIAALILYLLGSGPVKGFAVTLSIGIVASMFSSILLTRLMVITWLQKFKPRAIPL